MNTTGTEFRVALDSDDEMYAEPEPSTSHQGHSVKNNSSTEKKL